MYLAVAASANNEEEKEEHKKFCLAKRMHPPFSHYKPPSLQIQSLGLLANYHNSEADLGQRVIKEFVFV